MTREITDHKVNGVNDGLTIAVVDEPGPGGAHHWYEVTGTNGLTGTPIKFSIPFQFGPLKEHGVNGLTHEVLLAIIIDRLKCFQTGPYACRENEFALGYCKAALLELVNRTRERQARGVEGMMQK